MRRQQLGTRDLAVLGCFAALFVTAVRPSTDTDLWWHLATGRYILATGVIPHHDIFSATATGHPWITHEWLTEVVFYWVQSRAGYGPLMLLWAGLITAAFALTYSLARAHGASRLIALPVTLLAAAASSHTWGVRPQMLSLLFFAIYAALLTWPGSLTRWRIVAMVGLMPLWVNLHGGYIFGLLLIGLDVLASVTGGIGGPREQRGRCWQRARLLLLVLAGCLVAALANPNAWRALLYPFSYLGNNASVRYIAEWVSPNFHDAHYLFFEALLFLLLVGFALSARRPPLGSLLLCLVCTYLGLQSVRNIPLFCIIAVPVIVAAWREVWPISEASGRAVSTTKVAINWTIALVLVAVTVTSVLPLTTGQAVARDQAAAFPTRAVAFLRVHAVPQPLYNSYDWGGYLIWTLYPRYRVYIDGRPDMYGDAYVDAFMATYTGGPGWSTFLASQHIRSVLVEPGSVIAKLLALSRGWRLLYHDSQAVLYSRL